MDHVLCPHCGKKVEISEAIRHQVEISVRASEEEKRKIEIEKIKTEIKEKADKDAREKAGLEIGRREKENEHLKKQVLDLNSKIDKLLDDIREERKAKQEAERNAKEKMLDEENRIRDDEREKQKLEMLKMQKENEAMQKALDEIKNKGKRGSQQLQGEVMELEIERILNEEFPNDNIKEVKKGQRGADITQEVIDRNGRKCGLILWESKNAQWQNDWIGRLKDNQREAKAHLAILVIENSHDDIDTFSFKEGVWVCVRGMIKPLAFALRYDLIKVESLRAANIGKEGKKEILFQYITSPDFVHRVEAINEVFENFQEDMEREKRWFQTKWARQDKQIRKIMDTTHGMYGDLQSLVGKNLPEMKTLQITEGETDEESEKSDQEELL